MSKMKTIKTFRDLLAFLTIIPVGKTDDFVITSAEAIYLFPLIGGFIGLLGALYFHGCSYLIHTILELFNTYFFSIPIDILTRFFLAIMTLAFLLVLTGLQHFDGLVDLGNALGVRKLKDRRAMAHAWVVTYKGGLLAIFIEFLAVLGIFVLNPSFVFGAIIGIIYLLNKFIFPTIFKFAAKSEELLFITSIAVCLIFIGVFEYLGLSIAIGAFLAGLTLGNLPYNIEIISLTKPLRDFFAVIFFVALGMQLTLISEKFVLLLLILLGLVLEITTDECFSSWESGPALLNDQEIKVSETSSIKDSLVATGFPYSNFERFNPFMESLKFFMRNTHGVRRLGSAAVDLVYLACGRLDAFWEYSLNSWDVAAGAFIIKQAGGRVSDFTGGENWLFGKEIVAANSLIFSEFQELVEKFMMTGEG